MEGLEFASDDELINELLGRFEHSVFCGIKTPLDEYQVVFRRWKGNSATCAGLGFEVARTTLNDFEERSKPK